MPALCAFEHVSKVYGRGVGEVRALDRASFEVFAGDFIAVMGASGSGKSTTLNILGAIDQPTSGRYSFCGLDIGALRPSELARFRREYLGFVFQSYNLLPRTSALENVELPLVYRRVRARDRHEQAMHALAEVGLAGREDHSPAELSGGQQQRVAIARAIVTRPLLLLADEPTGNLDSERKAEIMRLLSSINRDRGQTIVMVTHEADMAHYARRIITFSDGRMVSDEARR